MKNKIKKINKLKKKLDRKLKRHNYIGHMEVVKNKRANFWCCGYGNGNCVFFRKRYERLKKRRENLLKKAVPKDEYKKYQDEVVKKGKFLQNRLHCYIGMGVGGNVGDKDFEEKWQKESAKLRTKGREDFDIVIKKRTAFFKKWGLE